MTTRRRTIRDNLQLEFRRGTLTLAVLSAAQAPTHAGALMATLERHSLPVREFTLYPLLRRLQERGLLSSSWNVPGRGRPGRPRRYYSLTPAGRRALVAGLAAWRQGNLAVEALFRNPGDSGDPQ